MDQAFVSNLFATDIHIFVLYFLPQLKMKEHIKHIYISAGIRTFFQKFNVIFTSQPSQTWVIFKCIIKGWQNNFITCAGKPVSAKLGYLRFAYLGDCSHTLGVVLLLRLKTFCTSCAALCSYRLPHELMQSIGINTLLLSKYDHRSSVIEQRCYYFLHVHLLSSLTTKAEMGTKELIHI